MHVHHIGYLVKKIEKSVSEFKRLGFVMENMSEGDCQLDDIVMDESRRCLFAFMKNGDTRIELVQPCDAESPIWDLLKKYKNCPYHICYVSDDLDADAARLSANGWVEFIPAAPAPAMCGRRVVFLMGANSGMIELVEEKKPS